MKLKSRSSVKKRVKVTGTGKIRFQKSSRKHLLAQKSKRQKKLFRGGKPTIPGNEKNIRMELPYI
jgi:large subunit ribosomal protein L35